MSTSLVFISSRWYFLTHACYFVGTSLVLCWYFSPPPVLFFSQISRSFTWGHALKLNPKDLVMEFVERVRLVVKGQRFESTPLILTSQCTVIGSYFTQVLAAALPGDQTAPVVPLPPLHSLNPQAIPHCNAEYFPPQKLLVFNFCAADDASCGVVRQLDAEFVGVILVYLRKLSRDAAAAFSGRWDEMPFDQQRSFSDVVKALGVSSLAATHGAPTVAPGQALPHVEPLHGGRSLLDVANEYAAKRAAKMQQGSGGSNCATGGDTAAPLVGQHASVDDDTLTMNIIACGKCGTTGHVSADCTFF